MRSSFALSACVAVLLIGPLGPRAAHSSARYTRAQFEADWDGVRRAKTWSGEGGAYTAANRILDNGDRTLPWLLRKLRDMRPITVVMVRNPPSDDFEERVVLRTKSMNDVARIFLMMLTGYDPHIGITGITPRQRAHANARWRHWYARYHRSLVWVAAARGFSWPGHELRPDGRGASGRDSRSAARRQGASRQEAKPRPGNDDHAPTPRREPATSP